MEIESCKKEILPELIIWPFWIIAIGVACSSWNWNPLICIVLFALTAKLLVDAVKKVIYLGRIISFTSEGCTFSILGHQNVYEWKNVQVRFCENKKRTPKSNDVVGPGILIYDRSLDIPEEAGPFFCRTHHPMKSVFIRFRSKADDVRNTRNAPRSATYGYVAEEDEVLDYLKSIGVY